MNDLTTLAERIEQAEGLSLTEWDVLNREIAIATGYYEAPDRGSPDGYWKPYTASLDAAMTLVPEGWRWSVDNDCPLGGAGFVWRNANTKDFEARAATPALALCAAALRARSAT